jgi:hypothetical protein
MLNYLQGVFGCEDGQLSSDKEVLKLEESEIHNTFCFRSLTNAAVGLLWYFKTYEDTL